MLKKLHAFLDARPHIQVVAGLIGLGLVLGIVLPLWISIVAVVLCLAPEFFVRLYKE